MPLVRAGLDLCCIQGTAKGSSFSSTFSDTRASGSEIRESVVGPWLGALTICCDINAEFCIQLLSVGPLSGPGSVFRALLACCGFSDSRRGPLFRPLLCVLAALPLGCKIGAGLSAFADGFRFAVEGGEPDSRIGAGLPAFANDFDFAIEEGDFDDKIGAELSAFANDFGFAIGGREFDGKIGAGLSALTSGSGLAIEGGEFDDKI